MKPHESAADAIDRELEDVLANSCDCTSFCTCGGCLVHPPTWKAEECKPHAPHASSCDAPGVYADNIALDGEP